MSIEWYPGIRDVCAHWRDAPMLQENYAALEQALSKDNDACIDCAKSIVEVVCRIIIDELDDPSAPVKPLEKTPSFGTWVGAAVRVLDLGENRNDKFKKLVSQYHKLTTALGDLRNDSGPVSHGRDGFLDKLSSHHRRSAILSADGIITFLHLAYLETDKDLTKTREPYERFSSSNSLIDKHSIIDARIDDEVGTVEVQIRILGDEIILDIEPSRLLYEIDREAYILALNASIEAEKEEMTIQIEGET